MYLRLCMLESFTRCTLFSAWFSTLFPCFFWVWGWFLFSAALCLYSQRWVHIIVSFVRCPNLAKEDALKDYFHLDLTLSYTLSWVLLFDLFHCSSYTFILGESIILLLFMKFWVFISITGVLKHSRRFWFQTGKVLYKVLISSSGS